MNEKQIDQRLKVLFDQLTLINLLEEEFRTKLGTKGYYETIDEILDEIIYWRKIKRDLNEK